MSMLLAQSLAIAALLWGPPACGTPTVATDPTLPAAALGYADRRSCVIDLPPTRPKSQDNWASICTTIVHEWGHLTGHGHSSNPRSVMYPEQVRPYWRCRDGNRDSVALLVGQ
jgi:hypothetical protein